MSIKRKLIITLFSLLGALVVMSSIFLLSTVRTSRLMARNEQRVVEVERLNAGYVPADALRIQRQTHELLAEIRRADLSILKVNTAVVIGGTVLGIGFFGAGILLILMLVRSIFIPLRVLQRGARTIGEGSLDHHIPIDSHDEIGDLARAFNQMVKDLKNMQVQIVQMDRMFSIGQLAGGVAHEINNPLTGVLGQAQLLLEQIPADHPFRNSVLKIEVAAQRCRKIIRALLDFAKEKDYEFQQTDVNTLIDGALDFTRVEMEVMGISLLKNTNQPLPSARVSPMHIQQVFLNVITNAMHAMPKGGKLAITSTLGEQNTIDIYFADTGVGISKEHLLHVFDPFFTTKDIGQGTGLGLTVSYGIIQRHGGKISVMSDGEGMGATFVITLPAG